MPHPLRYAVVRELDFVQVQGRALVVRIARDGVHVKRKGERWSPTAYFVSWHSLYATGARLRAIENMRERGGHRDARRGRRS